MRIQFSLSCQKGTIIPINYQAEISNWVFSVLSKSGAELQAWIQQRGFDLGAKNFKLFTFSPLAIYPYEMDQVKQEFKLLGNQVKLGISIYLDASFEQQVVNLFRQIPLQLGTLEGQPAHFEVKHWQILSRPAFKDTMQFKAVSPISITSLDEVKTANPYLMPDSETYDISFFNHAVRRFKSAMQYKSLAGLKLLDPAFPMHYRITGQSKSRLIHLKPNVEHLSQLRGFTYEFEVSLPVPMMEFCYYSGFGEYPHLGFGYVDMK
ncbi:MAG TPA: CRISPR-associated endoribonuclease Cas6 [Saprospiraceae bacterium]|nr:CRISPR-associated endoribonuclease Cas6 [Saprospiraceae bacterium]HNG89146.1 CRISPR-associated endoribonuclease Cas6 [Saprospiraceae bacterium]